MRTLTLGIATLLAQVAGTSLAASSLSYMQWEISGPDSFTASGDGVGGALAFSTACDDHLFRNDISATAATFTSQYGTLVQAIKFDSGAPASAALATAQVQFDSPLPAGSRLLAFDLDISARSERFQISPSGGNLELWDQLESQAGETSLFPTWSSPSGVLAAQGAGANVEEVTVFDVSGVNSLAIVYSLGSRASAGTAGASFAIGILVPEPQGLSGIIGLAAALPVICRRRAVHRLQ